MLLDQQTYISQQILTSFGNEKLSVEFKENNGIQKMTIRPFNKLAANIDISYFSGESWIDFVLDDVNTEFELTEVENIIQAIKEIGIGGLLVRDFYFFNLKVRTFAMPNLESPVFSIDRTSLLYFLVKPFCKKVEKNIRAFKL